MKYRKLSIFCVFLLIVGICWWYYDAAQFQVCHYSKEDTFVLFDFDGTLVDSFDATIEVCNQCAREYNLPPITQEQKIQLRAQSLKDFIATYVKVPWYKVLFLYRRFIKLMSRRLNNVRIFDGMCNVIKDLKSRGYRLGIISSNDSNNISKLLNNYDLNVFDLIYTDSTILSKNKIMQKFLDTYQIDHDRIIYVADEIRDIEATQRVGIRMIAVDWGFNSHEALAACNPAGIISHPAELIPALKMLGC